jgi:DNA repair photolyase
MAAVQALAAGGIPVSVFAMPVLPGITDGVANLESVARAASEAGARYFAASLLFLMPSAQRAFLPFLEREFPEIAPSYKNLYSRGAYLRGSGAERLQRLTRRLRQQYSLNRLSAERTLPTFGLKEQMSLFA